MLVIDNSVIVEGNPCASRVFDCDQSSLAGESLLSFCPHNQPDGSESDAALLGLVESLVETGTVNRRWRFIEKGGLPVDTEITLTRVSEENGTLCLLSFPDPSASTRSGMESEDLESIRNGLRGLATGDLGSIEAKTSDGRRYDDDRLEEMHLLIDEVVERLSALSAETRQLAVEARGGHLSTRGNVESHPGVYGQILDDSNNVLASIEEPLSIAGAFIDNLSHGRRLAPIAGEYQGDFEALVRRLNRCFDTYVAVHTETGRLIDAVKGGELQVRAETEKFEGSWKALVMGINGTLDAVVEPLQMAEQYIDRIAHGDIPEKITEEYLGDFNEIKNNLNACIDNVNALIEDAHLLVEAGVAGELSVRADADRLHGDYRRIVEGMNGLLDAVTGPVTMASRFIEDLSHGKRLKTVKADYRGEFALMRENIDRCVETYVAVHTETGKLIEAVKVGELGVRADVEKFEGSWKALVMGMNGTLDAVVQPLKVAESYIDRISHGDIPGKITVEYLGDFNEIKNNLNACIDNVNALIEDSLRLSEAAVAGKLDTRADPSHLQGDYRRIIEGVNATLDAMIGPVYEAMRVSQEYAACRFGARVDPALEVNGDFVAFRDALNAIGDQLEDSFTEIARVADAYANGDFSTEVNPALEVRGDLLTLKTSLNRIGVEVSRALSLVNRQVVDLSRNAERAKDGVDDVSRGANLIAQNAESVSRNAEQSENGIEQVLRTMEDLTRTVGDVSGTAESVARLTAEANDLAKRGIQAAEKAEDGMASITRSSGQVDEIINDIRQQMAQIGKIVGLISDIANQTNLLALNAAIEAARAGDAGRGFAVVAAEVKSLAQESRSSAENIAEMIGGLNAKSQEAAGAMTVAGAAVQQGNAALGETLKVFSDLSRAVEAITMDMTSVSSATQEQAASFEEITASVNEMAGLVKTTAKDAMHSSATSEEALAVVDQITDVIRDINTVVENVDREMRRFQIRAA
jgi:methyl-accepting chemotaxis protein